MKRTWDISQAASDKSTKTWLEQCNSNEHHQLSFCADGQVTTDTT